MQFMLSQHSSAPLQALLCWHAANVIVKDKLRGKNRPGANFGEAPYRAGLVNSYEQWTTVFLIRGCLYVLKSEKKEKQFFNFCTVQSGISLVGYVCKELTMMRVTFRVTREKLLHQLQIDWNSVYQQWPQQQEVQLMISNTTLTSEIHTTPKG